MPFSPPALWNETSSNLRKSLSVVLNSNGKGYVSFDTDNASQRWNITTVQVMTNQSSIAGIVPYATGALNTTDISMMSTGNSFGTSWSGNNDSFTGNIDVFSCDFFSVLFYPPPGQSGSTLVGVVATATVFGVKYTRRS